MLELRCLKAEHGDAFIIRIGDDKENHYIVVDGGPSSKYCIDDIIEELNRLPVIDLMVLTHYDDDHIAGLIEYISGYNGKTLPVKQIWANCSKDITINLSSSISYSQANTLDNLLNEFCAKQELQRCDEIDCTMPPVDLGFCTIQVLSPTPSALFVNKEQYVEKVAKIASIRVEQDAKISLEDLSKRPLKPKHDGEDVINRSSMALLIEAEGKTLLMMGDADPWVVYNKIKCMERQMGKKVKVDFAKVSHHGSKNNTCNELLDAIDCYNFIISTNGGESNSYHPDRETLAKLLCHPSRNCDKEVNLYFNYPLKEIEERTGELLTEQEIQEHKCTIRDNVDAINLN